MAQTEQPNAGVPLVEARNIRKHFLMPVPWIAKLLTKHRDQLVKAVDDVSLKIWPGETVGLVGESGCGKTTLGRVMTRLIKPTEGELYFDGSPVVGDQVALGNRDTPHTQMLFDESGRVGRGMSSEPQEVEYQYSSFFRMTQIIFQNPYSSLNPRKSIRDIIGVALRQGGIRNAQEREAETLRLLNRVGLSDRHIDAYPHQFSGGQRQRIGIARALAIKPQFIVADEPVSALDVSIQAQVINLLRELQEEYTLTFLMIAHDLSIIYYISDRVAVMYLGHIVEEAETESLFRNPLHPYTQALLAAIPMVQKSARRERIVLEGSVPNPINPPSGCPFHTRCFAKKGPECEREYPPEVMVDGHKVACWIYA